jgi:hypothetical protein
MGLDGHDPGALGQALQGREAEHAGISMPTRRQNQGQQSRQVEGSVMEALEIITYILQRTPNFFAGRPDEPC